MTAHIGESLNTFNYNDIIRGEVGQAIESQGFREDEVFDAFNLSRTELSEAIITINSGQLKGEQIPSFRMQVGEVFPEDCSRGGCELSVFVSKEKISHKAFTMYIKHLLGGTGNIGGKSGILVTPEQLEILKTDPEARADLFGQHALVHNINPDTNIMATDLNTFGLDMDSVAIALQAQYGELAGAAASGVSKAYGGEPELHAPRTGLGGAIMTDLYFRRQALTNERVAEAINGGRPLRAITQGLGKAGSHYLRTLPYYIQPVGAMERNGAIIADDSEYLDRDTILALARDTGLDQESVSRIPRTFWLPPATPENSDSLREFWAAGRADVLIPAFDRGQFTSEDAQRFDGSLVVGMANEATDEATQAILAEKEVDEIPDAAANIGGTLSSRRIGQKFRDKSWTQQTYETNWQQDISNVGEALYEGRDQLRQERSGEFVPLREIVARIAVQRAMDRAYLS